MSVPETAFRQAVAAQAGEQLAFLISLCEQNSHTANKPGVDRVAARLLEALHGTLPLHRALPQGEFGDHHLLRTRPAGRAVYLVGHMDTVFPPEHPFQACRRVGDRLRGPGAADMKGGLAVFVYALRALAQLGILPELEIALILNSDEEIGSVSSRGLFAEECHRARACLGGECAGPQGELVVSRNGKLGGRVDSFGEARHVGAGTHEKASAVLELAEVITALEGLNASLPGVSLNVGRIAGGLSPATIAAQAHAWIDARWREPDHGQQLRTRIREIVAGERRVGCRSEFTELNARPAWPAGEPAQQLFRNAAQHATQLGLTVAAEHRRGTSDVNFFGSAGVPALDGFGPCGAGDHTSDEWIEIASLAERTLLLARLLTDLARGE